MKIKENGNEIPIRKSITDLTPQGLYNPISVSKDINDKAYIKFDENFLKNNVKSSTLSITQNGDKSINIDGGGSSLSAGKGVVSDGDTINIDAEKFVEDITINGVYTEWSTTSYAKVDLNEIAKGMLESTGIEIYKAPSERHWNTNKYIDKCNKNINETVSNKKMTVLQYNNTYFYPFTIKQDMVISSALTYFNSKVSIIYVICVKDNDMVFYVSPTSHTKINPDELL